jgi:hypothetical protein
MIIANFGIDLQATGIIGF